MAFEIRLLVSVMMCVIAVSILFINEGCECRELNSLGSPPHSTFLKRHYYSRGRKTEVLCGTNPGLCNARHGYSNGNSWTCCSKRYCIDVSSDPFNCGSCGHSCGYGLSCCGGKCTNLFNDNSHCGACFNACHQEKCSFGICGYAFGYGYGYPIYNPPPKIGY